MVADVALLAVGFVFSVGSSFVLARDLDRVGVRLGVTEGLLGILTAIGADAPEISTAAIAVLRDKPDIGVGVVLGSNIFNLAGLLGLSALIAGGVRIGLHAAVLEGSAAILIGFWAVALALGWIGPLPSLLLVTATIVPYALLAGSHPEAMRVVPGRRLRAYLRLAVGEGHRAARPDHLPSPATRGTALAIVPVLGVVVAGSFAMVDAAGGIGERMSISQAVMGTLVLAILTSIPNVVAALRLAVHDRGSAVVSEAYNSNAANVLAGLCLPAAIIGLGGGTRLGSLTAVFALAMTVLSAALLCRSPGLTRRDGAALVSVYLAFVGVVLWL